jgi:hypothetical protein
MLTLPVTAPAGTSTPVPAELTTVAPDVLTGAETGTGSGADDPLLLELLVEGAAPLVPALHPTVAAIAT